MPLAGTVVFSLSSSERDFNMTVSRCFLICVVILIESLLVIRYGVVFSYP